MCGGARIKPLLGVFVFLNFCFFFKRKGCGFAKYSDAEVWAHRWKDPI